MFVDLGPIEWVTSYLRVERMRSTTARTAFEHTTTFPERARSAMLLSETQRFSPLVPLLGTFVGYHRDVISSFYNVCVVWACTCACCAAWRVRLRVVTTGAAGGTLQVQPVGRPLVRCVQSDVAAAALVGAGTSQQPVV
jgi:hypothetical protein